MEIVFERVSYHAVCVFVHALVLNTGNSTSRL